MRYYRSLATILAVGLGAYRALPAQSTAVSGEFGIVWQDDPQMHLVGVSYYLHTPQGSFQLDVSEATLRAAGGPLALNRHTVSVSGVVMPAIQAAVGASTGLPHLRVTAIHGAGPSRMQSQPPSATQPQALGTVQSGNKRYVTILCKASDSTGAPHSEADYQGWFGASYPGLDAYWKEQSDNQISVTGSTVSDWHTLPHPAAYYAATDGNVNYGLLGQDCADAAPEVDLTGAYSAGDQDAQHHRRAPIARYRIGGRSTAAAGQFAHRG